MPHQEQAYIENNGVAAWWKNEDARGARLAAVPPLRAKALKALFGLPEEKVRVIQAVTGGGFGGKEEYPNVIAAHAACWRRRRAGR